MTAAFDPQLGFGVFEVLNGRPLCEECRAREAQHIDGGIWRCRACWTAEHIEQRSQVVLEPWMRNGE